MKFIHRLGYYLGGFSIGLIFLAFFLSGKRASCDYGPDARVLKNIGQKVNLKLNMSNFSRGLYLLSFNDNRKTQTKKIVLY